MATSTISNTITGPTGTAVSGATVIARLMPGPGFRISDSSEIARQVETTTNGSGAWSLALERQANITPDDSWWEIEEQIPASQGGPRIWTIEVGASNATLLASLVTPSQNPALSTYLTQAAADARYAQTAGAYLPVTADAVRFVTSAGSDSNSGFAWGVAFLTIDAARSSLPAAGGTIYVGAGTFGSCTLSKQVRLVGVGPSTIIQSASSGSTVPVSITSAGSVIENLCVKPTGTFSGNLVAITGAADVRVERVLFDGSAATSNFAACVRVETSSHRAVVKDCRLLMNNGATNRGDTGVVVVDSAATVMTGNYVIGARQRGFDVRSTGGTSAGARILYNHVEDCTTEGILTWNSYTDIIGNRVEDCDTAGIFVTGDSTGGTTNNGSVVSGNTVTNCATGIGLENDVHQTAIVGNTVVAPSGNGISMVRTITDITVVGNTVQNAAGAYGGIACPVYSAAQSSARLVIVGNAVRGSTNSGVYLEDGLNSFIGGNDITGNAVGITVNTTYASAKYGPNQLSGNTANYSLQGTGIVDLHDGFTVAGGATITKHLSGSKTFDWGSVADGAQANTTVTVTGAALGDEASASMTVAVPAGAFLAASPTAADTVTVTLVNHSGGAVDLASGTLRASVWRHA